MANVPTHVASRFTWLATGQRIGAAYIPFITTCVVSAPAVSADHGTGNHSTAESPVMGHMCCVLVPVVRIASIDNGGPQQHRIPLCTDESILETLFIEGTGNLDPFVKHHSLMREPQRGIHKNALTTYKSMTTVSWALVDGNHTTLHNADRKTLQQIVKIHAPTSVLPDTASAEESMSWYFDRDATHTHRKFEFVQGVTAMQTSWFADHLCTFPNKRTTAPVDFAVTDTKGFTGVSIFSSPPLLY